MTAEQQARDMLAEMGVEDAQSFTAGDLVPLANLIAERNRNEAAAREGVTFRCPVCGTHATFTKIGELQ